MQASSRPSAVQASSIADDPSIRIRCASWASRSVSRNLQRFLRSASSPKAYWSIEIRASVRVELVGGELADTRFRIRRWVRADDPADLGAPLSYRVEVLAADDDEQDLDPAAAALSKSRQWVLTALRAGGELQTVTQLGDRLAQAGHPLKPRTIQTAPGELGDGRAGQGE